MGNQPEHVGAILLRIIDRWEADLKQAEREEEQQGEPEAAESEDNSEAVRRP